MAEFALRGISAEGLGAAGEAEWQRFRYQLGLTEAFWLSFLFTPAQATCRTFRQRTENILRAQAHRLRIIRPGTPDELRNALLLLFDQDFQGTQHVWIEALQVDPPSVKDGPWATAWDWFVMRLNERRDRMRRAIGGFVMLAAPPSMMPRIRIAAPDLWSGRAIVVAPPPNQRPKATVQAARGSARLPRQSFPSSVAQHEVPYDVGDPRKNLKEANGLNQRGAHREAILKAASAAAVLRTLPADEPQNRRLHQQALVLQAEAESEIDDNAAAMEHYQAAIHLALQGKPERIALHWFDSLLQLLQSAGRLDETLATARLFVEYARRLLEAYGESPQALRDISVSLDNLGEALKQEGDAEKAKAAYKESLLIRRRLLEAYGESPQALRDISVSLDNLGEALKQEGDAEKAKAAYI
jgi:tetratricopeptide (TPR) repeat protein